jgi:hypothetical protein
MPSDYRNFSDRDDRNDEPPSSGRSFDRRAFLKTSCAGVVAGGLAGVAYMLVLSLPVQTWVLAAADAYAHYGTLPVGLMALAGLVELGERSLPTARMAEGTGAEADPDPA